MRQRYALLGVATVVAVFAAASPAAASSFVYGCSSNTDPGGSVGSICRIGPLGHGRRVLFAGSLSNSFATISASAGGARLAFTDISQVLFAATSDGAKVVPLVPREPNRHILRAAMSPDGNRVAYVAFEDQPQQRTPVLYTVRSDGSDRRLIGSSLTSPGWFGDQLLAVPVAGNAETGDRVCIVDESQGQCLRTVARLPGGELGGRPAVSPDGRLVTVYSKMPDGRLLHGRNVGPGSFVYKTATGKLLGPVHGNGLVSSAVTWSPDGRAIAYTDAGNLYVQPRPPAKLGYVATHHAAGVAWTGAAGPRPAKLRITRATVTGRTLVVRATLARRRRTSIRAEFLYPYSNNPRVVFTVTAHRGRIAFEHRLPKRPLFWARCTVTLAFAGDTRYGWAFAHRTARGRRACRPS